MFQITQAKAFKWDISFTRAVNATLDFVDQAGLQPTQARGVVEAFGRLVWPFGPLTAPLRQVALHLYHPREDLGGTLGMLNFDRRHVMDLIEKGYSDAVAHDCIANDCVLPAGGVERAGKSPSSAASLATNRTASMEVVAHA